MVQKLDIHDLTGLFDFLGNLVIRFTWIKVTRWVVMADNKP
jgi:hypothetical protein